jgi:hypothetical protein
MADGKNFGENKKRIDNKIILTNLLLGSRGERI